jgi:hypothetical protein
MVNALVNRHGAPQKPITRRFKVSYEAFSALSGELQDTYCQFDKIWFEEWINKWSASKREAILKSIVEDSIEADRVKAFVKFECCHDRPSKARGIQMYPNLCTQSAYGPVFYSLQKAVCKVLYRKQMLPEFDVRVTIASGMNPLQLGAWMEEVLSEYSLPHFYERDGSNWDSSIQRPHFLLKRHVYKTMNTDPRFHSFVESSFKVKGVSATKKSQVGHLSYQLNGTVKSGHNDTTLGNGIVNLAIAYEACVELGLKADIIVTGDDLIVVVEGDFDEHKMADIERQHGIVPEYRKFDQPWQIEFASGVFVADVNLGQVYIPKIGRLLARLFWTVKPPSKKKRKDYIHSVVCGQIPLMGSIPVIGDFLRSNDLGGNLIVISGKQRLTESVVFDSNSIHDWFFMRYGLHHKDIEDLSSLVVESSGHPCFVKSAFADAIMRVDLAKLPDRFN